MTNSQKLARAMDKTESMLETTTVVLSGETVTIRMIDGEMAYFIDGRQVHSDYISRLVYEDDRP